MASNEELLIQKQRDLNEGVNRLKEKQSKLDSLKVSMESSMKVLEEHSKKTDEISKTNALKYEKLMNLWEKKRVNALNDEQTSLNKLNKWRSIWSEKLYQLCNDNISQ